MDEEKKRQVFQSVENESKTKEKLHGRDRGG